MKNPKIAEELVLVLRRTYPAPPERVFQAWTQPELVKKWFGPKGYACTEAELDLRVGGRYRIIIAGQDENHIMGGEYVEIASPDRLVFTMKWEHAPEGLPEDYPQMLVTVEFLPKGDGTEMVLTHERNPSAEVRDSHGQGWISSFDCLAEVLAG